MNRSPSSVRSGVRRWVIWLWLAALVAGLVLYWFHMDRFTPRMIAETLRAYGSQLLIAYLLVSVARAFFLIPSTPFVLAGGLLFPDQPWTVLLISMIGIALSATLIYGFSDWLGLGEHLDRLAHPVYERMEKALSGRFAFLYLVLWSFFPLVPTDAACYVAGVLRLRFWKFLGAICLGELIICGVYVLAGRGLWDLLMSSAR